MSSPRRASTLLNLWLILCAAAAALSPSAAKAAEVNGYADSRTQLTRPRVTGLLSTEDLPSVSQLLELNAQVRHAYREHGFLYGDVSLLTQLAGAYRSVDASGTEISVPDHDVAAYRPLVSLNELYLSHEVRPQLSVLLGKKRLIWGSGFASNPTDLLNPPKDPTDPNFQRSGAWLARIEVPLETFAFTLVASPAVLEQQSGLPYQFLTYPSWDRKDDQAHYQLAARAYALVANSDLNLMLFFGNRYHDAFENKPRLGASFSRYFFTDYELHVEGLFQTGSSRDYVVPDCVDSATGALGCLARQIAPVGKTRLEDPALLPRVLIGARTQLADETLFSLEYLYQADGYSRSQFQDLVNGLELLQQARGLGFSATPGNGSLPALGASTDGVPQKFSFEPSGRHYLFFSVQKPKVHDDFTLGAVLLANLTDFSSLLTPSVAWSVREWLTLTLSGFVPLPGPPSLAAKVRGSGAAVSEYTVLPLAYRGLFEARVFY